MMIHRTPDVLKRLGRLHASRAAPDEMKVLIADSVDTPGAVAVLGPVSEPE